MICYCGKDLCKILVVTEHASLLELVLGLLATMFWFEDNVWVVSIQHKVWLLRLVFWGFWIIVMIEFCILDNILMDSGSVSDI